MQIKKQSIYFLCLAALVLSGCSGSKKDSDLVVFTEEVLARPKGNIEPLPEFEPYESFIYSAAGLRAPFSKPVEVKLIQYQDEKARGNIKPNLDRSKEYLEGFSIDTIKMVGTITLGEDGLWALVDDSQSGVHKVKLGNYLGRNHGKVVAINQSQLDVIEIVPDGHGSWLERPRSLKLQDDL